MARTVPQNMVVGSSPLDGGWTLAAGSNVTFTYSGSTCTLAATGSGGVAWGAITGTLSSQSDLNTALAAKEATANKGQASGYASLDGSVLVPIAQIPTGATSSTVCIGNDSRLSDSRTPSSLTGAYVQSSFSVSTGNYKLMAGQLVMTSTATATVAGTGLLRIT